MWTILFEDDDILAIDKPEGVIAVPGGAPGSSLREQHEKTMGKVFVVHRLDKDVSGVLIFAKNPIAHRVLNRQFSERTVQKMYTAVVHGGVSRDRGKIDRPLWEFGSGRMGVDRRGKPSLTMYKVRERLGGWTLVDVRPMTGRRHQIRVHLYSIGHPVAGDRLYGESREAPPFPRLMLHASALAFMRPGGDELRITSPPPETFNRVLVSLREQPAPRAGLCRRPPVRAGPSGKIPSPKDLGGARMGLWSVVMREVRDGGIKERCGRAGPQSAGVRGPQIGHSWPWRLRTAGDPYGQEDHRIPRPEDYSRGGRCA